MKLSILSRQHAASMWRSRLAGAGVLVIGCSPDTRGDLEFIATLARHDVHFTQRRGEPATLELSAHVVERQIGQALVDAGVARMVDSRDRPLGGRFEFRSEGL